MRFTGLRIPGFGGGARRIASVDALSYPLMVGHRGGALVAPENTIDAFDRSIYRGAAAIELDVQLASDDSLVVMHDSTVDRTTDGSGSISAMTAADIRALTVDCSSWFSPAWPDTTVPLLQDVFERYRNSIIYFVEAKSVGSGALIGEMAQAYGLTRNVVVMSSSATIAAEAQPYGVATGYITDVDDAAANAAAGFQFVIGDRSVITTDYITNALAAGLVPGVYDPNAHYLTAPWLTAGAKVVITDVPIYQSERQRVIQHDGSGAYLEDPFAAKRPWDGPQVSASGRFNGTDQWGYVTGNSAYMGDLMGWGCPIPWSDYSITFDMTWTRASADATRWGSIAFAAPDDTPFTAANPGGVNCYYVILRQSGLMSCWKSFVSSSTATLNAGVNTGASIAQGATATVRIDVGATSFTVTRTDVDPEVGFTINDAAFRGGYFSLGKCGIDLIVDHSNVVIRQA